MQMVGLLITNHKSLVINMLCYACWQLDSQPVTMLCADQGWFSADRCNSSTCGWSRRKEARNISAMNTWAGFTPTLLTCDSAVLYRHTNWNNCQPISSLWCAETYFLNKKRCTLTSVYRTVVLESEIILHSEIEQRTEVSSLLELGAGGLNKCDLIYPQEAFDRYFSAKFG